MRTTGPSLVRAGQGETLLQRIQQATQNEDTAFGGPARQPVTLFAEDLIRGYRVDIRDHADGVWRSLHERDATYSVPGVHDVTVRDEGAAQPSGTLDSADPQQATTLSVHESLARWEGWSLSVQRPGLAVGDDGPTSLPSTPQTGGVPLTSSLAVVPGSLPLLRFGHSYDVRARAVDLGGGGLDLAGADAMVTLLGELTMPLPVLPAPGASFTFQRFEPVPAPVAVPREKVTEGESVERLVIRSSRTETAEQVAARLNTLVAAATPDTGVRYLGVCERHLVPPKSSQQAAERAGLLDGMAPAAAYFLCCKDKGSLNDDAVIDITTGQPVPLADVPDPFTGGTRPAVEVVASGTSAYPVHHEPSLLLPYLPDPHAVSAVLCGLPGVPAGHEADIAADGSLVIAPSDLDPPSLSALVSVTTIPFTGSWPLLTPLRLQLTEDDGPPAWDPAGRVLSVSVPAGRTATVRLSCALPGGGLNLLGQWQWLVEDRIASQQPPPDAAFAELAQRGLTWPLTPFREITLVHACQQPTLDPDITTFTATRTPGDTGAALSGTISLDAASTAKIDLIASWTDPAEPGQTGIPATAHVLEAPLPPSADIGQLNPGTGGASDVLVLGPAAGGGQRAHQEFGDTRYRHVTYQAVASTRFLEYFPSQVDVGPTSVPGTTFAVDVPSSAAPPAPIVREAVPTWQWDRPADPALPHRRHSAGVRLLLEPPWFASGDGEQLAVVLLDPAAYPPSDDVRPRVTHWGTDPAFGAAALAGAPAPAAFPAGLPAVNGQIDGVGPVVFVPHAVSFDADRGVCVCDIPIDPGQAYGPFVRLAVVRYQPHSLPGLETSHVVQVPFVQVLPERRVMLTPPEPGAPDTYAIQVQGITYASGGAEALPDPSGDNVVDIQGIDPVPPLVEVVVQERLAGTTDDAGWAPTLHPAVTVTVDSAVSGAGLQGAPPATPLWTGRVTLPAARSPGQFRILVDWNRRAARVRRREGVQLRETLGPPDVPTHQGGGAGVLPPRLAPARLRRGIHHLSAHQGPFPAPQREYTVHFMRRERHA